MLLNLSFASNIPKKVAAKSTNFIKLTQYCTLFLSQKIAELNGDF